MQGLIDNQLKLISDEGQMLMQDHKLDLRTKRFVIYEEVF